MANRFTVTAAALLCSAVAMVTPCFTQDGEATPDTLALALARNDVPAGVVVPEAVMARVPAGPYAATPPPARAAFREALGTTVREFNAKKGGFQASLANRVVHVRSATEPMDVSDLLERSRVQKEDVEVPALMAVYKYVLGAMRGVDPPDGFIGSGVFPGEECPIYRPVKLAKGSTTAVGMLDEVVKQAPGLVWFVTYRPESPNDDLRVGLMCPDGSTVKMPLSQ